MSNEKKPKLDSDDKDYSVVTSSDFKYILDVNQKAIQIYVEVEKQNEQILSTLEDFKDEFIKVQEQLENLKHKESSIQELLDDDNTHDHKVTHDDLKELKLELRNIFTTLHQVMSNQDSLKEAIEKLDYLISEEIKDKISEIEKNLFRLVIILGSAGIGTIFTIIQTFLHK